MGHVPLQLPCVVATEPRALRGMHVVQETLALRPGVVRDTKPAMVPAFRFRQTVALMVDTATKNNADPITPACLLAAPIAAMGSFARWDIPA
jgi:hypothetical protein